MAGSEPRTTPLTCPTCGGFDPEIPKDALPPGGYYCTPLSCDEWTITHRLTKQGKKPLAPDGRADLREVKA